jgi:NAD-dependent deacetylase
MQKTDTCPECGAPATRPDIVWFGEMPYHMDDIWQHLATADPFVAIGTSGEVYPAAAFVQEAAINGAHTIELNLDPSSRVSDFAETCFGPATQIVPRWVDQELSR